MPSLNTASAFVENDTIKWDDLGNGIKRKILAYDAHIMMVKVAFEAGAIGTLHQHIHSQVTHIESGTFEVEISGEKQVLTTNDVFIVPSNALHGVVCLEAGILLDVFSPMRADFL
jgi:quercetin dioxygenase-like cupin family protein